MSAIPVTARAAGRGSWLQLVRLWLVTLAANLVGGLVIAGMIVVALPDLRSTAARLGGHYAALGSPGARSCSPSWPALSSR